MLHRPAACGQAAAAAAGCSSALPCRPAANVPALPCAGFGRLQWFMLGYCGLAWLADACETMLLSYLGPAVRCAWGIGPSAESLLTSVVFAGACAVSVGCLLVTGWPRRDRT